MSSPARADRLEKWLVEVAKVQTENFSISVEYGKVSAEFIDIDTVDLTEGLKNGDVLLPGTSIENYLLEDHYQLSVVIRKQLSEDFQDLKLKLLLWLNNENQVVKLNYDAERNNENTYDYFFDLSIIEHSQHKEGRMKTC